jgi:hypothetical protein
MRVNRTLLYTGIFLVAIGGVVVVADLGVVDEAVLADTLGLWPLAVIAIGLGLVLRRTRASLSGGLLAAAVPGLLLGSAFAVLPGFSSFCIPADGAPDVARREGVFTEGTRVSLTIDCGSLDVTTQRGYWRLETRTSGPSRAPVIFQAGNYLSVESTRHGEWLGVEPDDWDLRLPMGEMSDLALHVSAGRGDIDLAGTEIGHLAIKADASSVVVDASTASVMDVTGDLNFGELSVSLPAGDVTASFEVDAGHARVCVPDGVGLRVTSTSHAGNISVAGVDQSNTVWVSPTYASAEHHADLEVTVDFGAIEINPIGGCK